MAFPGVFPVSFMKSGSIIKSIQPFSITIGTSTTSNTATINAVDTSKAVIFFNGFVTNNNTATYREFMARAELTDSTTVTVYRDTSSASFTVTVRGTVVEFVAGAVNSLQAGTVTIGASNTSGTATISSVTTSQSAVFFLGLTNSTNTTSPQIVGARLDLTNATTVTATRNVAGTAILTVGYAVVEFAAGVLNSVQQRSVTATSSSTTTNDTITSVNTGQAILIFGGGTGDSTTITNWLYRAQLTTSTNVALTRTGTSTLTRTFNYTVLEFTTGKLNSVQRNTTAVSSASSADATITAVNTAKAICLWLWFSNDAGTSASNERFATAKLLNSTTVRCEKTTAGTTTSTLGWEVAEFV